MRKLALALAIFLVGILTACGGGESSTGSNNFALVGTWKNVETPSATESDTTYFTISGSGSATYLSRSVSQTGFSTVSYTGTWTSTATTVTITITGESATTFSYAISGRTLLLTGPAGGTASFQKQ